MQISPCFDYSLQVTVVQLSFFWCKIWVSGGKCSLFFFFFPKNLTASFKLKTFSPQLIEDEWTEHPLHIVGKCVNVSVKFGRTLLQFQRYLWRRYLLRCRLGNISPPSMKCKGKQCSSGRTHRWDRAWISRKYNASNINQQNKVSGRKLGCLRQWVCVQNEKNASKAYLKYFVEKGAAVNVKLYENVWEYLVNSLGHLPKLSHSSKSLLLSY